MRRWWCDLSPACPGVKTHYLLRLLWSRALPNPFSNPTLSFFARFVPARTPFALPCPPSAARCSDWAPLDSRSLTAIRAVSQHPQHCLLWYTYFPRCGFPCLSYPENQKSQHNSMLWPAVSGFAVNLLDQCFPKKHNHSWHCLLQAECQGVMLSVMPLYHPFFSLTLSRISGEWPPSWMCCGWPFLGHFPLFMATPNLDSSVPPANLEPVPKIMGIKMGSPFPYFPCLIVWWQVASIIPC